MSKALVLLSGGLDSSTVLAIAQQRGFEIHALSFSYGQRHLGEIDSARRVAQRAGVSDHVTVDLDLGQFGGSALTGELEVPKKQSADQITDEIPVTYVPARNTIFLSFALAHSEVLGTGEIFIGVNSLDYSGYPDCRPAFIAAFQAMANLATKAAVQGLLPVTVHTPLIHLTKAEIIRRGLELGVDYSLTSSCYDPDANGLACGHCDACLLRLKGFSENGVEDPVAYAPS